MLTICEKLITNHYITIAQRLYITIDISRIDISRISIKKSSKNNPCKHKKMFKLKKKLW